MSPRYLFTSHDGFGLGHTRRNSLIADALLAGDPGCQVMLITGLPQRPAWLDQPRLTVVPVPPLLKATGRGYRSVGLTFEAAVEERARRFAECVKRFEPHVVIVDRHPLGTGGELRIGLDLARSAGGRAVLGLRDILDAPEVVRLELAGAGWADVGELYDEVLVYGARHFCDHEREYGLPFRPRYCGWVAEAAACDSLERNLLAVTAGGGGDGDALFGLAVGVLEGLPSWRAEFAVGPYADAAALVSRSGGSLAAGRMRMHTETKGCGPLFARASAVLQMAGYNSTFEALAAGQFAVLQPRTTPRAEQAIRAERLAALDLADMVAEDADPGEVRELLLQRPRRISPERVERSGVALNGAATAASILAGLAERVTF